MRVTVAGIWVPLGLLQVVVHAAADLRPPTGY